jgi:hypothetical protein
VGCGGGGIGQVWGPRIVEKVDRPCPIERYSVAKMINHRIGANGSWGEVKPSWSIIILIKIASSCGGMTIRVNSVSKVRWKYATVSL